MAGRKKISPKKSKNKKEEEVDPIAETKKRLEQQQKALQKIIDQFSKKQIDK